MDHKPKILVFAGSTRTASLNKKLARVAFQSLQEAGAEATLVDLKELPMPLYDGDLEVAQGIPDNGKKFKRLLITHDGFLISSPEYNSSITGVLKNAIDWASRSEPGEASLIAFNGKVAALVSASPGNLGGIRALVTVRSILGNIGVLVLPGQVAVPKAHEAFDDAGNLKDVKTKGAVDKLAGELVTILKKL